MQLYLAYLPEIIFKAKKYKKLAKKIRKILSNFENHNTTNRPKLTLVTLFSGVMSIDTSGIVALEELHRELVSQGIQVSLSSFYSNNVPKNVNKQLY